MLCYKVVKNHQVQFSAGSEDSESFQLCLYKRKNTSSAAVVAINARRNSAGLLEQMEWRSPDFQPGDTLSVELIECTDCDPAHRVVPYGTRIYPDRADEKSCGFCGKSQNEVADLISGTGLIFATSA